MLNSLPLMRALSKNRIQTRTLDRKKTDPLKNGPIQKTTPEDLKRSVYLMSYVIQNYVNSSGPYGLVLCK